MNLSVSIFTIFLISSCCALAEVEQTQTSSSLTDNSFQQCLEKDSISCVQLAVFRNAKSFFDKPVIEIFGGLSLAKNAEGRQGKSLEEDNSIAIETANTVEGRNTEMESYLITKAKNFFQERSLSFSFVEAARSVANIIPEDIKNDITGLVVEGRGRLVRKKLMKKLMPIILALKVKFVALGFLSLFGLLFVAKKALIISVIALGLAAFSGISSLGGSLGGGLSGGSGGGIFSGLTSLFSGAGSGIGGYSSGGGGGWSSGGGGGGHGGGGWSAGGSTGGWSAGGGSGGWDSHGAYSSPVAQSIAYSAQKPATR